jgi:hypothetical protein
MVNWCFVLREGVNIYGGFRGTERSAAERDNRDRAYIEKNETVLSGDMEGYGSVRHLIVASKITGATELDGFSVADSDVGRYNPGEIIINGVLFANSGGNIYFGAGGGIVIYECGGELTFSRLTVRDNFAGYGAGVCSYNSGSVFKGCTFSGNLSSYSGGALYITGTGNTLRLEGCRIRDNSSEEAGSAIYMDKGSLTVENTIISGNRNAGSSVIGSTTSSLVVTNTLITGNKSGYGGIYLGGGGDATFTNVTIAGNWIRSDSGAIYRANSSNGTYRFINTIVWGNGSASGTANIYGESGISFTNSLVEGWTAGDLGGGDNLDGTTSANNPGFNAQPATAAPTAAGDYTVTNSALSGIGYQYK